MCGTETSRPVLGGTIAILKSLGESTLPDLSLLFHQTEASTTTATFQSTSVSENTTDAELASCQIVILYVPISLSLCRWISRSNILMEVTAATEISELQAR
jgi:hypothetical protein